MSFMILGSDLGLYQHGMACPRVRMKETEGSSGYIE
jgi:hypothetical protein